MDICALAKKDSLELSARRKLTNVPQILASMVTVLMKWADTHVNVMKASMEYTVKQ